MELKDCPFCGHNEVMTFDHGDCFAVGCLNCHAEGPSADTRDEATEKWNDRAHDEIPSS